MASVRARYRRGVLLYGMFICAIVGFGSLLLSALTAADMVFGFGWGYEWQGIPAGIGGAIFAYILYLATNKIIHFLTAHFPETGM